VFFSTIPASDHVFFSLFPSSLCAGEERRTFFLASGVLYKKTFPSKVVARFFGREDFPVEASLLFFGKRFK